MIGLDTNVLVRYLVQDDEGQAEAASRFIAANCTADSPGFLNHIVLCELCWVLDRAYGYDRPTIAGVLDRLLRTAQIAVDAPERVWAALAAYRTGGADFADCLIAVLNGASGCMITVTFDRKAARQTGFDLLPGHP